MSYRDVHLSCVRCGKPLTRRTPRQPWTCRACDGCAIEVSDLARRLALLGPDFGRAASTDVMTEPRTGGQPRPCPRCWLPMATVSLHTVWIERCEVDHLMWFDRRELDRVLEAEVEVHEARKSWLQKLRDLLFLN